MIIISVSGNDCILSDKADNLAASNVMSVCRGFVSEYYVMPEEIFIIANGKLIEIDIESVLQSELDKQL